MKNKEYAEKQNEEKIKNLKNLVFNVLLKLCWAINPKKIIGIINIDRPVSNFFKPILKFSV